MQPQDSVLTTAQMLQGACARTKGESATPRPGTGSPTLSMGVHKDECKHAEGTNIPRDVNTRCLAVAPHTRGSTGMTAASREVSAALVLMALWVVLVALPSARFSALHHRVVFWVQVVMRWVRIYICTKVCPICFGLPTSVQTVRVKTGAPCVIPVAAACVRSAPVATVDKSDTGPAVRDQQLTDFEGTLGRKTRLCCFQMQ